MYTYLYIHSFLFIFQDCYDFYGSSEFSQDESGYNYCTWCGNGGKLIVCDFCPNGFCNSCIRRNFGRAEISETTKEGWKCYCCDNSRLKPKIKFCDLILNSQPAKKEKKISKPPKVISEKWLQSVFDESEVACRKFHRKITKVKSIGLAKSKSLKHIVTKIEDLINNHRSNLKCISATLNENFQSHIQTERKLDADSNHSVTILDSVHQSIASPAAEKNEEELSDSLISHSVVDESNNEKIQAKLKLLNSSSESDSGANNTHLTNEIVLSPENDNECNKNLDAEKMKGIGSCSSENACDTVINTTESNPDKCNLSNQNAKRKLSFSFSEASDNDFNSNTMHDIDKLIEEMNSKSNTINKNNSEEVTPVESMDTETDPKLRLAPKVNLTPCDHLFQDGKTYVKITDEVHSDPEAKLDKLIQNLCKLPNTSRKSFNTIRKKSDLQKKGLLLYFVH